MSFKIPKDVHWKDEKKIYTEKRVLPIPESPSHTVPSLEIFLLGCFMYIYVYTYTYIICVCLSVFVNVHIYISTLCI